MTRPMGRHVCPYSAFNVARDSIQVFRLSGLTGVGGLIQAAVGLLGGVGGWLTKRSGLSRNA